MMVLRRLRADEVSAAADVIAQRVKSILAAKTTSKGSWERSQAVELLGGTGSIVLQAETNLTGLGASWGNGGGAR